MSRRGGAKSFHFARSVSLGLFGQVAALAVNFFAIPILIRALGMQSYGLYILLFTATNYILLTTLGAATGVLRYISEFHNTGDGNALRRTARYAATFYVAAAAVGTLAGWAAAPRIASGVLHLSGATAEDAVFVLRTAAVATSSWVLLELAQSILQGLQLFGLITVFGTLQNAGFLIVAAALSVHGFGVRSIAVWYGTWGAVLALASAWIAAARLRKIPPQGRGVIRWRDFLRYAFGGGFGRFAWIVSNQLDKIYVARAVSLGELAFYSVPMGLLQRLQVIRSVVANVLIPMMSGEADLESARRMYLKSIRFVLWSALPLLVLLFAVMPQFLGLWLGGDFGRAGVWPARVLVLNQIFYFLEGQVFIVIFTRDKPWHQTAFTWIQALGGVLGWKLLVARYGILGIALGTLGAQALSTVIALHFAHRRLIHLSWLQFTRQALLAPMISGVLALAVIFPWHETMTTWPRLASAAIVVAAVYYGSTWLLMNSEDRALLKTYLSRYQPGA